MLHRLKAVASSYGLKPDWSAFGGLRLRHVEVIVWFGRRLVLDILRPHLIGNVAAACNPVTSRPQMLTPVTLAEHSKPGGTCSPKPYGCHACTLPSSQSTRKCRNPTPPKGVGFPDPLSGTLKGRDWR